MRRERSWQMQEAKARLSEVLRSARTEGPQEISVHGEPVAMVVSSKDYRRLTRRGDSFIAFMRRSPLVGVPLDLKRNKSPVRRGPF